MAERLIQEELLGQPDYGWRMLVACVLLNRTTGRTVRPVLREVLSRWPTPLAMCDAPPINLFGVLQPIGLGQQKAGTLKSLARGWLDYTDHETSRTREDLEELPGIGPYALDSWSIFVDGERDFKPEDKKLAAWLADPGLAHFDKMVEVFDDVIPQTPVVGVDELIKRYRGAWDNADPLSSAWWRKTLSMCASRMEDWSTEQFACARLCADKNVAYGSKGLHAFGSSGILIRSCDKLFRMENLLAGVGEERDESIKDTTWDLVNYAGLAVLREEGRL